MPLRNKEGETIARVLVELFTKYFPAPERWHADNGSEFVNTYMDAAREILARNSQLEGQLLPYSHGLPRNPQCQGLVENMNKQLKTKVMKKMYEQGYNKERHTEWPWEDLLDEAVHEKNRQMIQMYNVCAYTLLYGRVPEAPDHEPFDHLQRERLRLFAHNSQKERARRLGRKHAEGFPWPTFDVGSKVLLYTLPDRYQKNTGRRAQRGAMAYKYLATVESVSNTSATHYKLRWISRGPANASPGTVSKRAYPAYMLKPALLPDEAYELDVSSAGDSDLECTSESSGITGMLAQPGPGTDAVQLLYCSSLTHTACILHKHTNHIHTSRLSIVCILHVA